MQKVRFDPLVSEYIADEKVPIVAEHNGTPFLDHAVRLSGIYFIALRRLKNQSQSHRTHLGQCSLSAVKRILNEIA